MNGLTPYLWVAIGGALGANVRFGIARSAAHLFGNYFPYGTIFINITGSFLLGFIHTILLQRLTSYSESLRLLIAVGFLGSYTTFSTFEMENQQLLDDGKWVLCAANMAVSLFVGLIAVRMGMVLGRR